MFHSRQINHKINKDHERALRILSKDHFSSFEELLSKDKSVTVHQRDLQILATEMCKMLSGLSIVGTPPPFLKIESPGGGYEFFC